MRRGAVHVCRFDTTLHIRGRARTYEAVKAAVLQSGRFSVFEATESKASAHIFDRLCRDPEVETDHSCGYPWTLVRRKRQAQERI